MTCPKCGKEMEQGYLCGSHAVLWSRKKKFIAIPTKPEELYIYDGGYPEAHICTECRIFIAEY